MSSQHTFVAGGWLTPPVSLTHFKCQRSDKPETEPYESQCAGSIHLIHDDLRNEESKNDLADPASHVHTKNGLRIGPETAFEPSDANCPVRLSFLPGPTAQIAVCSSMKSKKTRPSALLVALCCFILLHRRGIFES